MEKSGGDQWSWEGSGSRRAPPIAPRHKYHKLAFPYGTETSIKDKWFEQLTKSVGTLGTRIVRPSNTSSPFVYVDRKQVDLISLLTTGHLGGIKLKVIETQKEEKYKEYLVKKYPKDLPITNAYRLDGVLKARRYMKEGRPLDQILIMWSKDYPPPKEYHFNGHKGGRSYIKEWSSTPTTCCNCFDPYHQAKDSNLPPRQQPKQSRGHAEDAGAAQNGITTTTGELPSGQRRHSSAQDEEELKRQMGRPVGENRRGLVLSGQGQQRPPKQISAEWIPFDSPKRSPGRPLDMARQLSRQQWNFPKNPSRGRGQSVLNGSKK